MKKIIFILFFGFSNSLVGQTDLSITPYFCQSWGDISRFGHDIELYKEGKLISKEFYPKNDFTVEKLEKGKYIIKYKTIFNQVYEREITLNKKKKSIEICIDDYRKIKEKTLIKDLKINDTLEIWAYETGCEYLDFGRVQIIKKGNSIEATLFKNKEATRKILSKKQIDLIEEIEHKIQLVKANEEEGYLRTSNYEIKLNGVEKVKTTFGFQAVGYDLKMKEIFKK